MKRILRILGALLGVLVIVSAGAVLYVYMALPAVEVQEDLQVELTPERVERGRYLANSVCLCMDCHAQRDWERFAGPPKSGTLGAGGERFDRSMQFPGEFTSRNITPHGLKDWSDGELYRAITSGIKKDGEPMFPVMPYPNYAKLATEDVYSIIAYLRSMDPIASGPYPASEVDFPLNLIMRTMPGPATPMELPAPGDPRYGEYMANAAGCGECHTNMEKGERIGEPYAGGFAFHFPGGSVLRSPNITPHLTDGIGAWDKDTFIRRFKQYADSSHVPARVDLAGGEFQTVMPWLMYATMSEQDIGAIYDYLHGLPPAAGRVERWTAAR